MNVKKRKQYNIYKIPQEKIYNSLDSKTKKFHIKDYSKEIAIENGEMISISDSLLCHKIRDYFIQNGISIDMDAEMKHILTNISIGYDKKDIPQYVEIGNKGFTINDNDNIYLMSGSGQLRNSCNTFVREDLEEYLIEQLSCGLTKDIFGEEYPLNKYNAYLALCSSGSTLIEKTPRIVVVNDYEEIKPNLPVEYIETVREKPEEGSKKRKDTINKTIKRMSYMNVPKVKPLNSFDGQGLCDYEYSIQLAQELGYYTPNDKDEGYIPSSYIIRMPWVKGQIVTFKFREYFKSHGVNEIVDIFGQSHNVDDIDILINQSMFKTWKLYYKQWGCDGWNKYLEFFQAYNLRFGVVSVNKRYNKNIAALNYQYINALNLKNEDIINLCSKTVRMIDDFSTGDTNKIYKLLTRLSNADDEELATVDDTLSNTLDEEQYLKLYERLIITNSKFIDDLYVREQLYKSCEKVLKNAKIAKIYCSGNYQFLISDPAAQCDAVIKQNTTEQNQKRYQVKGLLKQDEIYSKYWINRNFNNESNQIALFRSPMIDRSEIAIMNLVDSKDIDYWFGSSIQSGIVLNIHDLTAQRMQNCDYDGDRCYSTNDKTIIKCVVPNLVPLVFPTSDKQITGEINRANLIEANVNGLHTKVGQISNTAAAYDALLSQYKSNTDEYKEILKRKKILAEVTGMEIDKVKSGIPPSIPTSFTRKTVRKKIKKIDGVMKKVADCSQEELEKINEWNKLIPVNKPYYMRYIYSSLDRSIATFEKCLNQECMCKFKMKVNDLMKKATLSKNEQKLIDLYNSNYPVLVGGSVYTISKIFETYDKRLRKDYNKARNMLFDYAITTPFETDERYIQIKDLINSYLCHKKFITKNNIVYNADMNSKYVAQSTKTRMNMLGSHIKSKILNICGGHTQIALDFMVKICKDLKYNENVIYYILDDSILPIIKERL